MKFAKKFSAIAIALSAVLLLAVGCTGNGKPKELDTDPADKDFSTARSASAQENLYDYKFAFLPEKDAKGQGYVGDTMPYYENGTYYIYYLKDGGDSFNHSVYLTTTKDFVTFEEKQEPVLEADRASGQDAMIGTGSVVKVKEKYYFFYTGHNGGELHDPKEAIMVAEGTSPTSFTKKADWQIDPHPSLGQRNDFRDPQAYYDEANDLITLTITACRDGVGRILTYTLKGDLSEPAYGDLIYTNDETVVGDVYNLECSDTFKIGDKWYLTFSAQDGALWYTSADTQYGPYTATPKQLDGQLFYAAKHASDGTNTYLIGWARRSDSPSSTQEVKAWAGNLEVQKVVSDGQGGIKLAPVDAYEKNTKERVLVSGDKAEIASGDYTEAFRCFERYMVTGKFTFTGTGDFGFAFDYNGREESYKTISYSPEGGKISLDFNAGDVHITSVPAALKAGESYSFTYIQEGSVCILYTEGQIAFTARVYGASGKNVMLFSKGASVTFSDLKQFTYTY